MRVAVVGLGTAGAATAALLFDRGHDVVVLEQADDPRPVGAGIWLQALGQQVLDRLDLLEPMRAASRVVSRVRMEGRGGRRLLDLGYDARPASTPALGVHRGDLFALLFGAVRARGIPLELGARVTAVEPRTGGIAVTVADPGGPDARDLGRFDLVVGADGTRSEVRAALGLGHRDRAYRYGALWAIVPDPDGLTSDTLHQRFDGTRRTLGVLPTGADRASIFWSLRTDRHAAALAAGVERWRADARAMAGPYAPLVDAVEELLPATYRAVSVRSSYRVGGGGAGVLVGDAAHAMSPQLGAGSSLALADAWTLAVALERGGSLAERLEWYDDQRRAHVRWYRWWTRAMMPLFQSDLTPLGPPRDALLPVVGWVPGMPRVMAGTLTGDRRSLRRTWRLP
ncbi:FAD-dependent oxidoreductase [Nocardioides sp. LML1-1-1.1]|uniref:FAD-dependent oxidoreductase n=1 Tax=Nocardioides sp. LML1-1-1.1 TaxID=3135248 RepID=UPI0034451BC9